MKLRISGYQVYQTVRRTPHIIVACENAPTAKDRLNAADNLRGTRLTDTRNHGNTSTAEDVFHLLRHHSVQTINLRRGAWSFAVVVMSGEPPCRLTKGASREHDLHT